MQATKKYITHTHIHTHTLASVVTSHCVKTVGTVACLNSTLPSMILQVYVCVSDTSWWHEGGAHSMSSVGSVLQHQVSVCESGCISCEPLWLNLSVCSCSSLYQCLVSTPISSSVLHLTFADTIPSFSSPFPAHCILSHSLSQCSRACPSAWKGDGERSVKESK